MEVNILSLKWGSLYGADYANCLYAGVSRHLSRPFRFLCFTDDPTGLDPRIDAQPLPEIELGRMARTTWLKLGLFQAGLARMTGPCLFLDLDVIITGSMDPFFDFMPGKRCIAQNWVLKHQQLFKKRPDVGNSSIFRFDAGTTQFIVDKFNAEREWAIDNFHPPQTYLTYALGEKHYFPDNLVASFKRHCVPSFPLNLVSAPAFPSEARVVLFHGKPNPDVAIKGYSDTKIHRRSLPAPWIADHWQLPDAA